MTPNIQATPSFAKISVSPDFLPEVRASRCPWTTGFAVLFDTVNTGFWRQVITLSVSWGERAQDGLRESHSFRVLAAASDRLGVCGESSGSNQKGRPRKKNTRERATGPQDSFSSTLSDTRCVRCCTPPPACFQVTSPGHVSRFLLLGVGAVSPSCFTRVELDGGFREGFLRSCELHTGRLSFLHVVSGQGHTPVPCRSCEARKADGAPNET